MILKIAISLFVFIECLNVMTLYFRPSSKIGNGVGVFNALHKSQEDEEISTFVGYLINWVAGTKLIFIMLGIVIVLVGNETTQLYAVIALIISILSFYWRLYPTIKKLDGKNQISPKGYAKTLNLMIISFLSVFAVALLLYFFL